MPPRVSKDGLLLESVGIETLGGVFTPLVTAGCKTPCSKTVVFSTAEDGQSDIKLFLYRGTSKLTKDANRLGEYEILKVPPLPRGQPQVAVTFNVNSKAIELEALDQQSNRLLPIARVSPNRVGNGF
jgi:molecular chaperone DnaK